MFCAFLGRLAEDWRMCGFRFPAHIPAGRAGGLFQIRSQPARHYQKQYESHSIHMWHREFPNLLLAGPRSLGK